MSTTLKMEKEATGSLPINGKEEAASLCSFAVEGKHFGIDTRSIREVLGLMTLQRVPLAPAYIGGIVPYRGDVLTTVSLRAMLRLPPPDGRSCVLVLDEQAGEEHFGLVVDSVGGVVTFDRDALTPNPSTLDERSKLLFEGSYRTPHGVLVQLAADRISPIQLEQTGLFGNHESTRRLHLERAMRDERMLRCER